MAVTQYITEVDDTDSNKVIINERAPLPATAGSCYGEMYFNGNGDETAIGFINTPVQVNATYNGGLLNGFSFASGFLTYTEVDNGFFQINCAMTARASGALLHKYNFYIAINSIVVAKSRDAEYLDNLDTHVRSPEVLIIQELAQNDTISIWIENTEGDQNARIENLNCNAIKV